MSELRETGDDSSGAWPAIAAPSSTPDTAGGAAGFSSDAVSHIVSDTQPPVHDALRHRQAHYRWPVAGFTGAADPVETAVPIQTEMTVEAAIAPDGTMSAWHYRAQLDVIAEDSGSATAGKGDATVAPPFIYRHARASATIEDPLRAIPSQAHAFARESFVDELAHDAKRDPVELRLQHLDPQHDGGPRAIIRMVTERAAWGMHERGAEQSASPWLRGRGFAFDGEVVAPNRWSAWVVDVDVNRETGDIAVRRVVAGRAAGQPGNEDLAGIPASQIEEAVARATGVRLLARPAYDEFVARHEGHDAAAVSHELVASADNAMQVRRSDVLATADAQLVEQAAAPAAAAIANALFDATGVRFRAPPFDAASIRAALLQASPVTLGDAPAAVRQPARWRRWRGWLTSGGGIGGALGGLIGLACAVLPGPEPIAPIQSVDTSMWSAATLERGRLIAAAGDCAVCHTAPGGHTNAGGFALDTPFGTVWSTNITPDRETGIGTWSYEAFARAMRDGISRDGTHLYPAFPYTAFARMSESDMMALYAYLMSQPAVSNVPPKTSLPFPLNQRPLVAGWNWLFHDDRVFQPEPDRSALWNRGKYLVDGVGHCGACHTPRNALGAEKGGFAYLSGGEAEGWDAPSLIASHGAKAAPVPWTEDALFAYLRTGFSSEHGVAAGPMAPVVAGLATLPESDVHAIAHYIASLSPPVDTAAVAHAAAQRAAGADALTTLGLENGRRTFEAACAVCHAQTGGVGHFGVRPLMGLNTSVTQASPDNLLRVLHDGIDQPATDGLGYMPGFGDVFDDRQMAELAAYIRARYAPHEPAWRDLEAASARVRAAAH